MKIGAIICEYNPLHNGHVYHIEETRKAGITHLIAVLSDDLVQRGDIALLDKFDRAELAMQAGADLVLELPVPYSCASAEYYAKGAIQILRDIGGADRLSFGCSGELEDLEELAEVLGDIGESPVIRELLRSGKSYPSAIAGAVSEKHRKLLNDPNNLLALEYLKAIRKLNMDIQPLAIRRDKILHDSTETLGTIASGSFIRRSFSAHEQYESYLPEFTAEKLRKADTAEFSRLERVILYRMRMITEEELLTLPDMTAELSRRFLKVQSANSLEEFLNAVKSKCFTMARIRRILLYALTGIRKDDLHTEIPYIRVLAFNQRGTELLKRSRIPAGTSLSRLRRSSPEAERFAQIEEHTANLYGLAKCAVTSAEREFRMKIKIRKDINYV